MEPSESAQTHLAPPGRRRLTRMQHAVGRRFVAQRTVTALLGNALDVALQVEEVDRRRGVRPILRRSCAPQHAPEQSWLGEFAGRTETASEFEQPHASLLPTDIR